MAYPSDDCASFPPLEAGSATEHGPLAVNGPPPSGNTIARAPLMEGVPSPGLDDLWRSAFDNYGLLRPSEVTEIHVFRVIMQPSLANNACAKSVTKTGPNFDPFQTLEQVIDQWWDLELEEHDHSWMLSPVNNAYSWSSATAASSLTYMLTRKGNPFHNLRPHGVLEVIWGHRQWTTAIALPKWVNNYHCLGLLAPACGPILTSRNESCAMWCDNTRLSEELIECHIGSFVQVHIRTHCSDLVRIDLQAALQRSIQTLHLPVHQLPDELVKMKVFVPQGVTCFSSETFDCTSPFEYWQKALTVEGRRVYPRKNPDTMIFHRVHKSIEEICPVFEPSVKHFILGDTDEQAHIRTVIFALFTARYEFIGACHWTPITKVWDILDLCGGDHGWIIYHNNRRLSHRNVEVDQGDFFACYERSNSNPVFMDKGLFPSGDQEWIANRSSTALSSAGDATGDTFEETPPTFESTGDPLLLIGRRGAQRRQDDRVVTFDIDLFQ